MAFIKDKRYILSAIILSIAALNTSGQTHFTFNSTTGNDMTVIVQTTINPTINGQPLVSGDEIGVFTPAALCVGATTWNGVNNIAITVYGDNDYTTIIDGIKVGETLSYRIWDSSLTLELPATATYNMSYPATAGATYAVDGLSFLATLFAPPLPQKPLLVSPGNDTAINIDSAVFVWLTGTPFINRYSLEIATDSLMTVIISVDSSITDTTNVFKGLTSGTSYWWRVKARNGSGWGGYSDTFKLTVNSTAVVLPESYSLNFYMMSNVRYLIKYSLPHSSNVSFKLYSMQGKCIRSLCNSYQMAGNYQIPVNLASLSKGFYLLSFTAGNYVVRKKLLNF